MAAELRRAVLRVPPAQEALLWAALRPLGPAGDSSMAAVLRAWWEHHDPSDVGAMERAANELQAKGGFAAALDLVRWAEGTGRRVSQVKIGVTLTLTLTLPLTLTRSPPSSWRSRRLTARSTRWRRA